MWKKFEKSLTGTHQHTIPMATKQEKLDTLQDVFRRAQGAGICRTQKEFAELIGVTHTTISSAMNGSEKHLTDSLIGRVRSWELNNLDGEKQRTPERPPIIIPAETQDMYNNMARAIADLTDILRHAGISVSTPASSQKNYLRDGKWND